MLDYYCSHAHTVRAGIFIDSIVNIINNIIGVMEIGL